MSQLEHQSHLAPTLTTKRLVIREVQPSDWEALNQIVSDPEARRFMHIAAWETPDGRLGWFDWCISNQKDRQGGNYNWVLVLASSGRVIGWLVIGDSDRKEREGDRSMGYMVAREHWGHGYMTEALRAILRYEFEVLGVRRVVANCETNNPASARVMEKAGMQFVQTLYDADPLEGNFAERHHYALEKQDFVGTRETVQ